MEDYEFIKDYELINWVFNYNFASNEEAKEVLGELYYSAYIEKAEKVLTEKIFKSVINLIEESGFNIIKEIKNFGKSKK